TSGPYKLCWDFGIFRTLLNYWNRALGPGLLNFVGVRSANFRSALVIGLTAGLIAFWVSKARKKCQINAFFLAWFVIVLAPLLPLRDHQMIEYLTSPTLGLAMWGGWAVATGFRSRVIVKFATATLVLIYAVVSITVGRATVKNWHDESMIIRDAVTSVV